MDTGLSLQGDSLPPTLTLLVGAAAGMLSLHFMWASGSDPRLLAASMFFVLVCATDTLQARIPNPISVALMLFGLGLHFWEARWVGLGVAMAGLFTGGGLLLIPYLLGKTGAGDVKALAALGALCGPMNILNIFVYIGLIGGVIALLNLLQQGLAGRMACHLWEPRALLAAVARRGERMPYAPAMALGYFAFTVWGRLI